MTILPDTYMSKREQDLNRLNSTKSSFMVIMNYAQV